MIPNNLGHSEELPPEWEPDEPSEERIIDYSSNGLCPLCGLEIYTATTGGECNEFRQYCPDDDNCQWSSIPLLDC